MGNLQRTELYFLQLCQLGSTNQRALQLAWVFLLCHLIMEGRRMRGKHGTGRGVPSSSFLSRTHCRERDCHWLTVWIHFSRIASSTSFLKKIITIIIILHRNCSCFPSLLFLVPSPNSPLTPQTLLHPFLHLFQKRAGLPWISTTYGVSSCSETRHLPLY